MSKMCTTIARVRSNTLLLVSMLVAGAVSQDVKTGALILSSNKWQQEVVQFFQCDVIHYSMCNLFLQSWGLTEIALLWIQNQHEPKLHLFSWKEKAWHEVFSTSCLQVYYRFSGCKNLGFLVFFVCFNIKSLTGPPEIQIMNTMLLFGNWTPRSRLGHQSVSFTFTHTEKKQIVFFSLGALRQEKYCFAVNF